MRNLIRSFIEKMDWATSRNIDILLNGKYTRSQMVRVELGDLCTDIKNPAKRLKKFHNQAGDVAYSLYTSSRDYLGSGNKFYHDCKLRDCVAKFLHDRNYEGLDDLKIEKSADAVIGNLYFEFDNGSMDITQLEEKLREHYSRDGKYQVIFFMRSRTDKPELEDGRIKILFQAVENVLRKKRGRVLAVGYLDYLNGGTIGNWKGEKCAI